MRITESDTCAPLKAKLDDTYSNGTTNSITGNSSSGGSKEMTLEKCLAEHTREETLDEANAWYDNILLTCTCTYIIYYTSHI